MRTSRMDKRAATAGRRVVRSVVEPLEGRAYFTMTIGLQVAGTGSHAVSVTSVGQVINLQAVATISGTTAGTNDAFYDAVGSFLGTVTASGGVIGNLADTLIPTFAANGGSAGVQQDLNGDGGLDIGSNSTSSADAEQYFVARSGDADYSGTVSGDTNTFVLATLTYTVKTLGTGVATDLAFRPSGSLDGSYSAFWIQDGQGITSLTADANLKIGAPVVVTGPSTTTPSGSIAGEVFKDANDNGKLDSGESAFSGAEVYLDLNDNGVLDSTDPTYTVGSSGTYSFNYLPAGTFYVREVVPSGYTVTTPANDVFSTTITTGEKVTGANFGDAVSTAAPSGSITGEVFKDANDNGKLDSGESAFSGVEVYLDLNDSGTLTGSDPTYTVGSSGTYSFNYLPAGTFYVREVVPSGYAVTTPANGVFTTTITAGQKVTGANFGNAVSTANLTGSIAGEVFDDANSNGKLDSGESPLSGVEVYLDLKDTGTLASGDPTYTVGSNGTYSFNYLPAGTFYVREVVPSGYTVTTPANNVFTTTLASGQMVTGANFGNGPILTASIAGEVFHDANGNGKLDTGESAISGATVYLDLNKDGKYDSGDVSYVVGSSGTYSFNYLPAGTFYVGIVLPSGYSKVTTPSGGEFKLTVTTGEKLTGENFGLE
jgi:uncharacterized protein (DUF2141 family)